MVETCFTAVPSMSSIENQNVVFKRIKIKTRANFYLQRQSRIKNEILITAILQSCCGLSKKSESVRKFRYRIWKKADIICIRNKPDIICIRIRGLRIRIWILGVIAVRFGSGWRQNRNQTIYQRFFKISNQPATRKPINPDQAVRFLMVRLSGLIGL